jgi:hypothetical protein
METTLERIVNQSRIVCFDLHSFRGKPPVLNQETDELIFENSVDEDEER